MKRGRQAKRQARSVIISCRGPYTLHVKNNIDIQTALPLFRQNGGYKNGIGFPV